jgi:ATP-binding protein involved in chromosome partitioning
MYKVEDGEIKLDYGKVNEGLVAIASGKGGVGKSTITVNLAIALAKLGKKVGIVDADIHGFSIPRIIGLKGSPQGAGENVAEDRELLIPPEVNNIKVMSMGSLTPEDTPIIWRAPLLGSVLKQFMKEVQWGDLDYLLFDLPPGTGDMALNIMQQLPHAKILIVTTPQVTATNVAGRIGKMAEKLDSDIMGVIENMSYYQCDDCGNKEYIFGRGGGKKMAQKLGTDLLGELPLLPVVREGSDKGESVLIEEPESTVSKRFIDIAEQVIDRKNSFS